ncbi:hypothetical protein EDB80DRAFT_718509 [Ilyonectria destructans]|nr:hypothetical protein EDB80DRAFT_718509 [Ilyonectria destructans]
MHAYLTGASRHVNCITPFALPHVRKGAVALRTDGLAGKSAACAGRLNVGGDKENWAKKMTNGTLVAEISATARPAPFSRRARTCAWLDARRSLRQRGGSSLSTVARRSLEPLDTRAPPHHAHGIRCVRPLATEGVGKPSDKLTHPPSAVCRDRRPVCDQGRPRRGCGAMTESADDIPKMLADALSGAVATCSRDSSTPPHTLRMASAEGLAALVSPREITESLTGR